MGVVYVHPNVSASKLFCDKFTFTIPYAAGGERQHVLQALKEFLATRPAGDRRRIHPVHIAYLNHETERCIATVHVSC